MKILVYGCGYIGISTMLYFTKAGFEVHGIDLDMEKLNQINLGKMPQKDLEKWLDFNPKKYLKKLKVSHTSALLKNNIYDAIFIAIPTEKDGEPWFKPLEDVIENIIQSKNKDTLTIIESTLTPGVADKYIEPYLKNFVIAPRRDWFTEKDKTVITLPRIVGGNTIENTKKASNIIGKVCQEIHTCNYKEAQLVKACENTIRHIGAVFAQQLAWAYPNVDTKKVLKLASSKWNIPEYFANILGTSGYCLRGSEWIVVRINGLIYFKKIEELKNYKNNTLEILSYNIKTEKIEFSTITKFSTRTSKTLTIKTQNKHEITVTPDHIMYIQTHGLWERFAKDIREGDILPFINNLRKEKDSDYVFPMNKNFPEYIKNINGRFFIDMKYFLNSETYRIKKQRRKNYINMIEFIGKNHATNNMPEYIKINQDFARLIGYFVAEGCVTKDNNTYRNYFSFNKKEIGFIKDVQKILNNLNIKYISYDDKQFEVTQTRITSNLFGKLFKELAGSNSYDSKFPEFLLFYPSPKIKVNILLNLLNGYLNGDGSISKNYVGEIFTSSAILKQQLLFIFRAFGLKPTLKKHNNDYIIRLCGKSFRDFGLKIFKNQKLKRLKTFKSSKYSNNIDVYPNIVTNIIKNKKEKVYSIDTENTNFFTTGGLLVHNCIPVSSKYVKYGAKNPNELKILDSTLSTDELSVRRIANLIINKVKPKNIGILGMSYLGDIKVHVLSGALRFIEAIDDFCMVKSVKNNTIIKIHDPLYTSEEIKKISDKDTFDLKDLKQFDIILVASDHEKYKKLNKKALINLTKNCKFILDNCGIWEDVKFKCPYIVPGRKDWLNKLRRSI